MCQVGTGETAKGARGLACEDWAWKVEGKVQKRSFSKHDIWKQSQVKCQDSTKRFSDSHRCLAAQTLLAPILCSGCERSPLSPHPPVSSAPASGNCFCSSSDSPVLRWSVCWCINTDNEIWRSISFTQNHSCSIYLPCPPCGCYPAANQEDRELNYSLKAAYVYAFILDNFLHVCSER